MQPGPRVYTFFLYLSDVEEGGGTKFDGGFTVAPAKGKAVFWPATRADEPFVRASLSRRAAPRALHSTCRPRAHRAIAARTPPMLRDGVSC